MENKISKSAEELGIETLESFCQEIHSRLGLKDDEVTCIIQDVVTVVFLRKGKNYKESKTKVPQVWMKTECFKLCFIQHNSNTVELYWIETFAKCKGMGTDIMNTILDVADELGVKVRAIPADFDHGHNGTKAFAMLRRLREWYVSFGFQNSIIKKAVYTYNPS